MGDISTPRLALVAGLPVLAGVWLLLAPQQMLSREMTWDLMLNLSGAWHLHTGQTPHVDYHDPLGSVSYRLTQLGFLIVGPNPRAFLVGQTIFMLPAFVAAVVAASRRLAPIPATVFVLYVALLVLMPANVGDLVNAYSFAMSYNRWGWSLLMTLCLVLFLPPRAGRSAPRLDAVLCGALLVILFHLKITFAVAGVAALMLALVASHHVRAQWRMWATVLAVVLANAAAPYNYAYLADIWHGVTAGLARSSLQIQFTRFLDNRAEYALYGSGVLALLWLWQRGQAPLQSVVLAGGALGIGIFALSQNAQLGNIPLGVVIAYLIYDAISGERREARTERAPGITVSLAAVMIWPLLSVTAIMMTLAGYHRAAQREGVIFEVEATNLRSLAVPVEDHDVADALATIDLPYAPLGITREPPLTQQLSQFEYVQTLMEAASLFGSGQRGQPKIWVVDQVNPMPFVLGFPPPRGEGLWTRQVRRPLPADEVFRDVDVVLIPKFPTYAQVTMFALTAYHDYLTTHFPVQEQSPSWTILSRQASTATAAVAP